MLNQQLAGHTMLNRNRATIDNNISEMCSVCLVREDPDHFLFYCKSYAVEKDDLVEKVETIINREGLDYVGVVNMKVLNGNIGNWGIKGKIQYKVHFYIKLSALIVLFKMIENSHYACKQCNEFM